ncbi:AMP-binding protein [Pseudomonas capsici]|uniref:AMP-binding protein n=1 Tax=Pseudomonas capsici TaxID=2810614 RepID=A0ABT3BYF2_9PSED|nr:AMP-binding protein [Pseudomonas capsici]MBN6715006.1 AMP-binding protein [Pseudomonas capsici]MBN6720077.1 AMP-binding protein [Pseudomonas capsici]MBN6724527.1 AMP-binding protein [Pseudomonas capsici]MCV4268663.1 AMP-binding protein [Pseudomonas capsici]MCV4279001.1 AMP-binding protein [Pseudomonas capsici]
MMQPKKRHVDCSSASLDLVARIDMWADQCPEKIAIMYQGQPVTYAELSCRRKALTRHLIHEGIGVGSKVGICLPRGGDLIIALTAVLSIGAIFVPLPPDSPLQRNELISRLAGLDAVIKSQSADLSRWSVGLFLNIESVDWSETRLPFEPVIDDLSLAYILFTSGSTGIPKGVMVRRQNLAYFLSAINEVVNFSAWGALVSATTYGFDISILEFFLPLAHGGTLYLASEQQARDGQSIARLLDQCERALFQATPATWRLLIEAGWPRTCCVGALCGGEILPTELGEKIFQLSQAAWNLYGPTETTIWSFFHRLQASDFAGEATSVPIGQPLPGTHFRLHPSDDPLAPELVIQGPGVSAGYFNRDDLTAEKFHTTDSSSGILTAYSTGDRVRCQSDGSLIFMGRKDRQLKLNGYRIEPGEVESALHKSGLVSQSVVTLVEHAPDDRRLTACIVLDGKVSGQGDADSSVWLDVWEAAYLSARKNEVASAESGYTSSFTGELIPDSDLREWVEATASRVMAFSDNSVLDVGCGIGMTGATLLERGIRHYVGCDASEAAVESARSRLDPITGPRSSCAVVKMAAHELDALEQGPFDVVLLNSVIQYFPDRDYLVDVLQKASGRCKEGGVIVIGDVPCASLKHILSAATSQTRKKLKRALPVIGEGELWLDPLQIRHLAYTLERVVNVETELRGGQGSDEMTRYRYDVIIRLDADERMTLKPVPRFSYRDERLREQSLDQWLASAPSAFVLSGVPNARISLDLQLSESSSSVISGDACDPEYIRQWASRHHRQARIRWSDSLPAGMMDIFVGPPDSLDPSFEPRPASDSVSVEQSPVREVGDIAVLQDVIERLKESLRTHVPSYMIPAHFVFLDRFPLTFNGKLDVAALERLVPQTQPSALQADDPQLSIKQRISRIWSDILMTSSVHPEKSFFAQGGSSLLIVNLTRRLNDVFGLSLQVSELFEESSIDAQVRLINKKRGLDDSSSLNSPPPSSVKRRSAAIQSAARKRLKQL